MQQRPHRSAVSIHLDQMLREGGRLDDREPAQLDLFAGPAEGRLFKRRRGRPPTARVRRKYRQR